MDNDARNCDVGSSSASLSRPTSYRPGPKQTPSKLWAAPRSLLLFPNNDVSQRRRRLGNGKKLATSRPRAVASWPEARRKRWDGRLTPRRRAGDAVGDPRELVLDGVRREVVMLRRGAAAASTPGHLAAAALPRSRSTRTTPPSPRARSQCERGEEEPAAAVALCARGVVGASATQQ